MAARTVQARRQCVARDFRAVANDPRAVGTLATQFSKFGVVGLLGFITDVGGFNLLVHAGGRGPLFDAPVIAASITGVAATLVAWLGNRYWTFRHTRRPHAFKEFVIFAVVCTIGTIIAMACLWISRHVLMQSSFLADNIAKNVIGLGLGLALAFRFWAYRRHVFNAGNDGSALAELAEAGEPGEVDEPDELDGERPTAELVDSGRGGTSAGPGVRAAGS